MDAAAQESDPHKQAKLYGASVAGGMRELRAVCDQFEVQIPDEIWALPKYREMLFIR